MTDVLLQELLPRRLDEPASFDEVQAHLLRFGGPRLDVPDPRAWIRRVDRGVLDVVEGSRATRYRIGLPSHLIALVDDVLSTRHEHVGFASTYEWEGNPDCFYLLDTETEALLVSMGAVDEDMLLPYPEVWSRKVSVVGRTTVGHADRVQQAAVHIALEGESPPRVGQALEVDNLRPIFDDGLHVSPATCLALIQGYGGQNTGDIAYELALEGLTEGLRRPMPEGAEARAQWLVEAFASAARQLRDAEAAPSLATRPRAQRWPGRAIEGVDWTGWGAGSASAVVAILDDRRVTLAQIGEVVAWMRAPGSFEYEVLGEIDRFENEFAGKPIPPELAPVRTRGIGVGDSIPRVFERSFEPGAQLVLLTASVLDALGAERVKALLLRESPRHAPYYLVRDAKAAGSGNASAMVVVALR